VEYKEVENWQHKKELIGLLDVTTAPKHLYAMGTWDPTLFENCAAIVGSRNITSYGQTVVEKLIPKLVSEGVTIISGFMYGVDQHAHLACIDAGGKTIAVLGWGITTKLSGNDLKLANRIVESGGLLLSEWEDQKAAHWTFPARNRIVAALSKDVYVVEAALQSGSLITARLAQKLKRQLWAVPGPITSRTSLGTNKLIAEGKARMWLGDEPLSKRTTKTDDPILQALDSEPLTADEIALKLSLPVSHVGATLSMMLISGQILQKGGTYYIAHAR